MITDPEAQRWIDQLELVLIPSYACNLRCAHCFVASPTKASMPLEPLNQLLQDAHELGIRAYQLTGGELLAWKFHRPLLQRMVELGLGGSISSNGLLLEREHLELLADSEIRLSFSLDGPPALHDELRGEGAFVGLERATALCRRYGVPFELSSTVTRRSLAQLRLSVQWAARLGAQAIRFCPVQQLGGRSLQLGAQQLGDEELIELAAQLILLRQAAPEGLTVETQHLGWTVAAVKHPCSVCACWGEYCPSKKYWPSTLFVLPDGEVLPQSQHVHRAYSLGNVFEQDLPSLLQPYWQGAKHRRFMRLCRHVYEDQIFPSSRPFFFWDELLRQASCRPPESLPEHDSVSHPYDHGPEIEQARAAGLLDEIEFPAPRIAAAPPRSV